MKHFFYSLAFVICLPLCAQNHEYTIDASFSNDLSSVEIKQSAIFHNTYNQTFDKVYINDWSHAFSDSTTPLANHFAEEYSFGFHRASNKKRGHTKIHQITDNNGNTIRWERLEEHPDILEIELPYEIKSNESLEIKISYTITFPSDKFTQFGITNNKNAHLSFWYLTFAAVSNQDWVLESHLNLDDLFVELANFDVKIALPSGYNLVSDFPFKKTTQDQSTDFSGNSMRRHIPLYIVKQSNFKNFETPVTTIVTDLAEGSEIKNPKKSVLRVSEFVSNQLGKYSFDKLLLSSIDYDKRPIYGLNELPKVVQPFENEFLFELSLLKIMVLKYFENNTSIRLRKDNWLVHGIQTYLLMEYVNQYHSDKKLLGKFASFWALKNYELSKTSFNDQYELLYKYSVMKNLDQPLTTPSSKLTRYNSEISNRYKAALGLRLLDGYLKNNIVKKSIMDFYERNRLSSKNKTSFTSILQKNANDSLSWFFDEFVSKRSRIDYKITSIQKINDSIRVSIKNKTNTKIPIPLVGLKNDTIVYKKWIHPTSEPMKVSVYDNGIDNIVLNNERLVPESNYRNNYKSLTKRIITKPIKFTLLKDIEDPSHHQVFYIPKVDYNLYDGFSPGIVLSNKTLIPQNLLFKIQPFYSSKEKTLIGSATFSYFKNYINTSHYRTQFWLTGNRYHYQQGLFYRNLSPSLLFSFRNKNFRSSKRHYINLRYVYVERDFSLEPVNEPDYGIFNIRYSYRHKRATKKSSFNANIEMKNNFTKFHTSYSYRNFFKDDYQFNIRLFAGVFLKNNTTDDYFSFGISSVQDYLFEHRLLGRSESEGFFSQQFVWADAGFKSKINAPLANEWLISLNTGVSIWKWVEAYGDVALIKRKQSSLSHGFDSGIRLNLVSDYFELFFPVYSSLGFELNQPQYADKIRFVVVLDLITLSKLITRKWL